MPFLLVNNLIDDNDEAKHHSTVEEEDSISTNSIIQRSVERYRWEGPTDNIQSHITQYIDHFPALPLVPSFLVIGGIPY